MFEVGFSEILLIFGIALLVLGPEKLPKLAADVGRWAGRARAMARQLRTQLEQEVQYDPMKDQPAAAPTIHAAAPAPPAVRTPAPGSSHQEASGQAAAATAVTDAAPAATGGSNEPKPA